MTRCNATLTTATVKPCPSRGDDYAQCLFDPKRPGLWLLCEWGEHVELHTLTCDFTHTGGRFTHEAMDDNGTLATWCDDTPGATPHKHTPAVTDAEVQAAFGVIYNSPRTTTSDHVRAALEAAAAVRAAQEGDR